MRRRENSVFQKPVGLLNQMPLEYLHFTQLETLKVFWKGSQNQNIPAFQPILINIGLITQLTTEKQPQNSRAHWKNEHRRHLFAKSVLILCEAGEKKK